MHLVKIFTKCGAKIRICFYIRTQIHIKIKKNGKKYFFTGLQSIRNEGKCG